MPLLRIQPLFEQYATLLRPTALAPVLGSGLSGAEIFRATTPLGPCVLRCWPDDYPSSGHIQTIHKLLARAHELGCKFVPVPLADLAGRTLVEFAGRRWQLEPWMPGTPDLAPYADRARIRAAIRSLSQLHKAFVADRPSRDEPTQSPALLERLRILEVCLAGDIDRVRTALDSATPPAWQVRAHTYFKLFRRGAPDAYELLRLAAIRHYYLQPVVRDVHREHILFADGASTWPDAATVPEVTGLIDFGALTVDSPAIDLARMLGSYEVDDAEERELLLDAYTPPLLSDERLAVAAFDRSGALLSPFRWLWWLFVERRTFRDADAVARRFDVLLQRLTRLLDAESAGGGLSFST